MAVQALTTHVITRATLPHLFPVPAAAPAPLPVVAVEPQWDGAQSQYHKIICEAIATQLKAAVAAQDMVLYAGAGVAPRSILYQAGKYGMAQDGRHGDHDARKRQAEAIVEGLLDSGDAHHALAFLAFRSSVGARGYKIDDLCDAFLITLERAVRLAAPDTKTTPPAALPLQVAGFDIGPRNFAYCQLELHALPVHDGDRATQPSPAFRIVDWALFDLKQGDAAAAVAVARVPAAATAEVVRPRYRDIGMLLTLRSERQEAARLERNAKAREKRASLKRARDAEADAEAGRPKRKKQKKEPIVIDVTED
jgi:hypothetical protein